MGMRDLSMRGDLLKRIAQLEHQLERRKVSLAAIAQASHLRIQFAALCEALKAYRAEYDTPCPDLSLRVVIREPLWKLLDRAEGEHGD